MTVRDNVWEYDTGYGRTAETHIAHRHPAIFPVRMARDHIRTWTNPGDLVLDPMVGSGTVMRAAKDLGRQSIGIEISDEYIPNIIDRLAQIPLFTTD